MEGMMRKAAIPVMIIGSLSAFPVHVSVAANWIEFFPSGQPALWVDMDSVSHEGPLTTFDVVAGKGDPAILATDARKHSKFAFGCNAHTVYVYISRSASWLGPQLIKEPEDERMYKLVCNAP
jgi:hypothetical protein